MQNNIKVLPIEKIISILSYLSMGIVGLLWIIFAHVLKTNLKYFLMYNISQSMVIAIILAIFKLLTSVVLSLISKIAFLDLIVALFNLIISVKIIKIHALGISFTLIELFVFILLAYICTGVILGRIFYVPILSKLMNKALSSYKH